MGYWSIAIVNPALNYPMPMVRAKCLAQEHNDITPVGALAIGHHAS